MPTRPLWIAAAVLASALVSPRSAAADAHLETPSGLGSLRESNHELAIQLAGVVAQVGSEHTIVNEGKSELEAVYTFELPGAAVVTGLAVRLSSGRAVATQILAADAAVRLPPSADDVQGTPDVGLLRLVEQREADGANPAIAVYELRVYPIPAGRAVSVRVDWLAPLEFDDGRLSLRVPARGADPALARTSVSLALESPPGARSIGAVFGGGRELARAVRSRRARFSFDAPSDGDLVIEAEPQFADRPPAAIVSFATAPVGKGDGAIGVSVLVPRPSTTAMPSYERVVAVIDVSRSMEAGGVKAAAAMLASILDAVGYGVDVEVLLFDRTVHRVFGSLRKNDRDARRVIEQALAAPPLANGSDLGLALDTVRELMQSVDLRAPVAEGVTRGVGRSTLIAILTDGMSPLELTAQQARDRIGDRALAEAEVLGVTVVPDSAPAPNTVEGPLGALARATGGRSVAVRVGGAAQRARELSTELTRPTGIELASLAAAAGTELDGLDLPPLLEPGRGLFVVGSYRGRAPTKLTFSGTARGKTVVLSASRMSSGPGGRAVGAFWLAQAPVEALIPPEERIAAEGADSISYDEATLARAHSRYLATARAWSAITRSSSLVAYDARDPLSKDRMGLATKHGGGLYFRMPPPPERDERHSFRDFRTVVAGSGSAESWRPTGELSHDIVARLMRAHVLPAAFRCYQSALPRDPKLFGSLLLIVEIARGEVQDAHIERSSMSSNAIDTCVVDSAYTIQVPRVALGDDVEVIGVARYPIKFQRVKGRGEVTRAPDEDVEDLLNPDTPLGGLPGKR